MAYNNENVQFNGSLLMECPDDYIVIDIETTGLNPVTDYITEISALKYRKNCKVDEFVSLVKPDCSIPSFITRLTGIDDTTVATAPKIEAVITAFKKFIGEDILIGYNIGFDLGFLAEKLLASSLETFDNDYVDVMKLSQEKLPFLGRAKQTVVAKYFSIPTCGAHRADVDCEICNGCYQKLKQLYIPGYELPEQQKIFTLADVNKPFLGKQIAFLGILKGYYIKNLEQLLEELGATILDKVSATADMVIVGTGDAKICDSEELAQAVALKSEGAQLALLKDDVFVKALISKGLIK